MITIVEENMNIKNLVSSARFDGEFSFIDFHIVGSRKIMQEIYDVIYEVVDKYPKEWKEKEK